MGYIRLLRFLVTILVAFLLAAAALEGTARLCRTQYGDQVHAKFFVKDGRCWDCYMINELGAMGYLRTVHERINVAVVGGSPSFNNGFDASWPQLLTQAIPYAHLDNFSATNPHINSQLALLEQLRAKGLQYDILFYEPAFASFPEDLHSEIKGIANRWNVRPVFVGRWPLLFPNLFLSQARRLLYLDKRLARAGLLKTPKVFDRDWYEEYVAGHGPPVYRDVPGYFSPEDQKLFANKMGRALQLAKRIAARVVVIAPLIHYHGAADGSDRGGFYRLTPTGREGEFVSLRTFAEMTWVANRQLQEIARKTGAEFYDGNAVFSVSPDHASLFYDQFHLLRGPQPVVAGDLLRLLGYGVKVRAPQRTRLSANEWGSPRSITPVAHGTGP